MNPIEVRKLEQMIYFVRGKKVMLDSDLANLYGVETFNLNKAVYRNSERFPSDLMFQLTELEYENLMFQIGISSTEHGKHRKYLPYVFTQEGIAMLSGVLRSKQAIQVNLMIMRTFVKMRELLESNQDLAKKIIELESKYDGQFKTVFDAIRQLMHGSLPVIQNKIKPPGQ